MDIFNCEIYFEKRFWKIYFWRIFVSIYFWKEYLIQIYVLAYDEKVHATEWLYKKDSDPSFTHEFNVIELSLLGF